MAKNRKLGRTSDIRKSMLRSLATEVIVYGKVETTVTRAKETRSIAEKMITLGKGVFSGENKLVLKSNCGLRVLLARLE